jgi:signal transduction histidine kinase
MRFLRDASIQKKLARITQLAIALVLVMVAIALVLHDLLTFRSIMVKEMTSIAQIIGSNSAAAVVFKDVKAGENVLAALGADPRITAAHIYTKEGKVFASYPPGDFDANEIPATLPAESVSLGTGRMALVQPILLDDERLGTLYLQVNLEQLHNRILEHAVIVLGVLLFSSLVALSLSSRLQGMITQPIQHLTQIVKVVTEKHDYSIRAIKSGQDELGLLADGFNEMLARIRERDVALQQAHDQLEERVHLRTQELQLDIAKRIQTEERLQRSEVQLRDLTAHLQSVREEERAVIAREIHDTLGQLLTCLMLNLAWVAARLPHEQTAMQEKVQEMHTLLDSLIQSVRRIALQLRPAILDDLGLVAAIEWQAKEFRLRTGIACEFTNTLKERELDRDLVTTVFRILQEALTNVIRHAHATRVTIRLAEDAGRLCLTMADNGRGITAQELTDRHSLGLLGMRERALLLKGGVDIVGRPASGTTVTVSVPLSDKAGVESSGFMTGVEG